MNISKIGDCLFAGGVKVESIEIYIDFVFFENLVINYLILMLTAKISRNKTSSLRMFTGSLIGASYVVLLLLLPHVKVYNGTVPKILLSLVMVAVSFNHERFMAYVKTLAIFYISTFVFGGAAYAFLYFGKSGGFINNAIIYSFIDSKWTDIFISLITVGIIVRVLWDMIQYRLIKERLLIPLKIIFKNKITNVFALVDTGNSLHDPLTNMPVVVVEFKAIKEMLPDEIVKIFEESREIELDSLTKIVTDSEWLARVRLIPFTSLGKENGMLIGFKPDYIEIGEDEKKKGIKDVVVGIYNRTLSKNESYKALLSPELVS